MGCHSVRAIGQSASTRACKRQTTRREHVLFAYLLTGAFTKVPCPWQVLPNEESITAPGRTVSMHVAVASVSFGEQLEPTRRTRTRFFDHGPIGQFIRNSQGGVQ